jgi:hypothetical protein
MNNNDNKTNKESSYKINIIKPLEEDAKSANARDNITLNHNLLVSPSVQKRNSFQGNIDSSLIEKNNNEEKNIVVTNFSPNNNKKKIIASKSINIAKLLDISKNKLGSLGNKKRINNNIINVKNSSQKDVMNLLKFTNNIYQKDEHLNKGMLTKKLNINEISNLDNTYFSPSSNQNFKKKLIIQFNSGDKIRKPSNEESLKRLVNKMSKSSKMLRRSNDEKINFSNFLILKQNNQKENMSDSSSKNIEDIIFNSNFRFNSGDCTTKTPKNFHFKFNQYKFFKKNKSKKKTKKKEKKGKQKKSSKSIKNNNTINNQILEIKNEIINIKQKDVISKDDENKIKKEQKKPFFKFCNLLCCWNSKLNDSS